MILCVIVAFHIGMLLGPERASGVLPEPLAGAYRTARALYTLAWGDYSVAVAIERLTGIPISGMSRQIIYDGASGAAATCVAGLAALGYGLPAWIGLLPGPVRAFAEHAYRVAPPTSDARSRAETPFVSPQESLGQLAARRLDFDNIWT